MGGTVGGTITRVGQQLGIIKKVAEAGGAQLSAPQPAARAGIDVPSAEEMDKSSRRRARRGGRALLSEARLNPEEGVGQSTLGTGPM